MPAMSWLLMTAKGNKERKLKDIKKYFDRFRSFSNIPLLDTFRRVTPDANATGRADKDGDGEISREDWFNALTKAGVEITK